MSKKILAQFVATVLLANSYFIGVSFANSTPAEIEVRRITPPNLTQDYIDTTILCHRPLRKGSPNLTAEKVGDQVVVNNYGHGGSGWTLAPGSAKYVLKLMQNTYPDLNINASKLSKAEKQKIAQTPIAVIGAGVIGLFTAYSLVEAGYKNITIYAKEFDGLTSHNAGGLLAPVSMDNNPELQKVIDEIGVDAYNFYKAVATQNSKQGKDSFQIKPFSKNASLIIPTYFETREESGLEPYVNVVMKPAKDVIVDFENGTTRNLVVYDDGIFIDTAIFMHELNNFLREGVALQKKDVKVKFEKKTVKNVNELKEKVVFNASGLGARDITVGDREKDKEVMPVQGHLIMLKNQKPENLQYMILVYFGKDAESKYKGVVASDDKIKRSFYIFPKKLDPNSSKDKIGVIGGTFIEGADATTPNTEEFNTTLKNARAFYGIKEVEASKKTK
jgi:D-amino-acid oxidase